MKLRELKEWVDTKDDVELDREIVVSDRMWAEDERDIYQIVKIGYQSSSGYVMLVLSQQMIDILNEKDELKRKWEDGQG